MTQVNMVEAKEPAQKRIGVAEGKFKVPDEFEAWDKEVEGYSSDTTQR